MKKNLLTLVMAFAAMNINAQLVVDSLGRVGIGVETPKSLLSVGDDGDEYIAIRCNGYDKEIGMFVNNLTDATCGIFGVQVTAKNTIESAYGGTYAAIGGNSSGATQTATGLAGYANRAYTSIGIFGGKYIGSYTPTNFAGVYGSETGSSPSFWNHSGQYAGYFYGKVRVTNGIYATVLSPSASPSSSGQNGTTILSDRGDRVTDKLSQVQTLQILRYDPTEGTNTQRTIPTNSELDDMSPKELDSLMESLPVEEPERYLSPVQYGLDADQLKAVYPELVYEDDNGNVSINYVEMVPLLVQCINELKNEIAELKGTSQKKAKAQPTAVEESVSDIDMVRMDQNKPNPFSESTVITLNIPQEAQTANIYIYDMSGKQVQSLPVRERGETNITVYASDLAAGMYIYTLVVDGKVAVTRRMVVSKV